MSWTKVELGDVVSFLGGGTPSKSHPEYWGGDIPWATVKDIKGPSLDVTIDSITEEGLKNSASRIVPTGSVILPTRMALGKVAITTVPIAINQDLKVVVPKRPLNSRFLLHFLQSASNQIQRLGAGATVQGVTLERLARIEIPLPPLDEQRQIAVVLDKADALRQQRQESLRLTDQFLHSVFIEMFGTDSSPRCPRVKLSDHLDFITSGGRGWAKYYSKEGDKFIRSLDVQMNEIKDSEMIRVKPPNNAEAERTRIRTGDVLLTITGSLIGRVAPVTEAHTGAYISQHVAILRTHGFRPEFLSWAISTAEGQRQIRKNQTGQTKPGLNFEQIERLTIPRPSDELEQKFGNLIKKRQVILAEQRSAFEDADNLFSSIQQRAFLGELDLSRITLTRDVESSGPSSVPEPPKTEGRYKRPGSFIAPPEIEAQMLVIEDRIDYGPGDSIPWSKEFFKYRILSQVLTPPFSFSEIWEAVSYDIRDANYEDVKAEVFEYIEAGILEQQFDMERKEIVFYPRP